MPSRVLIVVLAVKVIVQRASVVSVAVSVVKAVVVLVVMAQHQPVQVASAVSVAKTAAHVAMKVLHVVVTRNCHA
jgi:hypothetical protein